MRVCLVCEENGWIFGKFALKMKEALISMGIESIISDKPINTFDINHFIPYYLYTNFNEKTCNSLMITHVDNIEKLNYIRGEIKTAGVGICMSSQTYKYLAGMGVDASKLTYVNPAHDGVIPIKKIVIGFACRVQGDGRKREYFLNDLSKVLDPHFFKFRIMGDGWEPQVDLLEKRQFEVDYFNSFSYNEYIKFIPSLDYYLYMGMDEGQMGVVDALAAGIKTIVTNQGYHLDAVNGITYGFTSYDELKNILLEIEKEKRMLVDAVKTWNWLDYTKKHVEIWKYLLYREKNISEFQDGLNIFLEDTINENYILDIQHEESRLKQTNIEQIRKRRVNRLRGLFKRNDKFKTFNGIVKSLIYRYRK